MEFEPAGYWPKKIAPRPFWLGVENVERPLNVGSCSQPGQFDIDWESKNFNERALFNSPDAVRSEAENNRIDLSEWTTLYLECFTHEYEEVGLQWTRCLSIYRERVQPSSVIVPKNKKLMGYDVVAVEYDHFLVHSPLLCNGFAKNVKVNSHCLLDDPEQAMKLIEEGFFDNGEPPPWQIFAVYLFDDE